MVWFEELQNHKEKFLKFSTSEKNFSRRERQERPILDLVENQTLCLFINHGRWKYRILCNLETSKDFIFRTFWSFEEFRNQKFEKNSGKFIKKKFEKTDLETELDSLSKLLKEGLRFMKEMVLAW